LNATQGDTFKAARWLIGARVVSSDGKTFGHVVDLELDPTDQFRITGLELGRFGWLDRLRLLRPLAHGQTSRPLRIVAWSDVERFEGGKLICRSGAKVTEQVVEADDELEQPARTAAGG
jgi:hypothetical protein